jgi:hypothetical protein
MQKIKRLMAAFVASTLLFAGAPNIAVAQSALSSSSAAYDEMRQAAKDAQSKEVDRLDTIFEGVADMNVERMACLDMFKNLKLSSSFGMMSMSEIINKVIEAVWDAVCSMAINAYQNATSGMASAINSNLELPGEVGKIVGPVASAKVGQTNNVQPFRRSGSNQYEYRYDKSVNVDTPSLYK